ncbi:uncharacterized protein BP5553_05925 [Venustampulla echinocandica]|uniref:Uncharacterized protein n=1 Tax=Venustampulla echinocandica TaxID=2656787 RepID=A0A370TM23_9HELO|nr:uncharacterized protein BP5553_05925 [Venustampulla echinocandica]RDL36573.1 hypothetical protein BP5553_05925 [Venustampulla echinocandica]
MTMLEEINDEDLLELRRDVIVPHSTPMIMRSENQQRYFQNCWFIVAGLVEYCRFEFEKDGPLAFKMYRWLHVAPEEMEETKSALIGRLTYNHVDSTLLVAQTIMGRDGYTPEMMKELPETSWKETRVWGNYGGVVQNSTGVGPPFGIYAGAATAKLENGLTWRTAGAMSNRWYYHYQNIEKGLVALEEAQREANKKASEGERKTEKRSVPYLYRWAARPGFELNLRLLRTYEVNRGRSCGYICLSETIDTIYNQCLGTDTPTKASILTKKLKPTMLLEHNFEPLNRELPARQGFRGLKSTGPCVKCMATQPHPHPEKLKTPITPWYRHPDPGQAHRILCYFCYNQVRPKRVDIPYRMVPVPKMDRNGPCAACKSPTTDASSGWSLDTRIQGGIDGGQLCKTCHDIFIVQHMLLDSTELRERRSMCSYFKCTGKVAKKKGPRWYDHPENIDKVPIAEYRNVCATCFGKIHKKDLPRRKLALDIARKSILNLEMGVSSKYNKQEMR